jgi:glycosyltransferase involved in cell wall biosynthesis
MRPPQIGFEQTGLELDATGTARSIRRLGRELEADPAVELVPLAQPGRPRAGTRGRLARGLRRELFYLPFALPRRAARLGLDLLHCPVPLAPVRSRVPVAITVHDVMALEHPEWFTAANRLQQRLVLGPAARRAAVVLTPSEVSREGAIEWLDLDPERVRVTPWGVDEVFSPGPRSDQALARLGVHGRYLLTVGALRPRKNLEGALATFEALRSHDDLALVVAGGRGWDDGDLLARVGHSPAADRIRLTGQVSDEDLAELYRGTECFLFPSRYEGFGLPPLEAMACGAPVVSSDRSSMPEVVGDAALLVPPDDTAGWVSAVEGMLASPERRAEVVERGRRRAAGFTWQRCARATVEAYRFALERGSPESARSAARTARQ